MNTAAPVFVMRIPQFSDYRRTLRLRNATTQEYVDLTGYLIEMQIRETPESAATLVALSSAAPTPDGTITISTTSAVLLIPDQVTAALDFEDAVYDVRFTSPGGVVQRILQGPARLDRGVTR